MQKFFLFSLLASGFVFSSTSQAGLKAGVAAIDVTPQFEERPRGADDFFSPLYNKGDKFFDTGVDRLFDFEEAGAFGSDGKPGLAGVDDDQDGVVDNCDRSACGEYLAAGADDLVDPEKDNFDKDKNPAGTEKDGKFQYAYIAGFDHYFPEFTGAGNRFASKLHDPLWARSIAVEGAQGQKIVLVSVDSPGILWKILGPVRRKISKDYGVPVSNIIIAATHSHYAPDPYGFWWSFDASLGKPYADYLQQKIYESAALALKNMQDVNMKSVTTDHFSCYDPKTGQLKREADCNLPSARKEFLNDKEKSVATQFDEFLLQFDKRDPNIRNTRILAAQFVSTTTGQTVATVVNWHNHPDSLLGNVMDISSDYPHYVREFVETKLGGQAVYFSGTVGCQIGAHPGVAAPLWDKNMKPVFEAANPTVRTLVKNNSWDRVRSIGYEIGNEVVAALQQNSTFVASDLVKANTQSIDVPIDVWLHKYMTTASWTRDVEKEDAIKNYAGRCEGKRGCVPSDVSLIELGDVSFIAVPGEMDPAYFLGRNASSANFGKKWGLVEFSSMPSIDQHMPGKHHGVIGMANQFLAYFVPGTDLLTDKKHPNFYEESVSVGTNQGDEIGDLIMQMLGAKERFKK